MSNVLGWEKWQSQPHQELKMQGSGFNIWTGGPNHDVLAVCWGDTFLFYDGIEDAWQEDANHPDYTRPDGSAESGIRAEDITVSPNNSNIIAVRYGRNIDMARLYGMYIGADGSWRVQVCDWPSTDGIMNISLDEFGNVYGDCGTRHPNWLRTLHWHNNTWYKSIPTFIVWPIPNMLVPDASDPTAPNNDRESAPRLDWPRLSFRNPDTSY